MPFQAAIKSKDGSPYSSKVSDVKITIDGVERTLIDEELTISTNTVKLDGEEIQESSAKVIVPVQPDREPRIHLQGNASVSNLTSKHSIRMVGHRKEWRIDSVDGMYAVVWMATQGDGDFRYFEIIFGAKGQPESVDSDGLKRRPHIALFPDGNGKFIRLAGYRCALRSQLNYDPATKSISPAIVVIDCLDWGERLTLKFEYHPDDSSVVLTEVTFV